jgi:hypothetical protein
MRSPARWLSVLRQAIAAVLRSLAGLPQSAEVEELKAQAEGCLKEVKGWSRSPPPPEDRDRVSTSVLKVRAALAKLERASETPGS